MVEILSVGARGPLGLSSLQLTMCLRAGRMEPHSLGMLDKRGREIGVCITGGLSPTLYGFERMVALAVPAIREAARGAELLGTKGRERAAPPIPLVLCLPEAGRPDDDARLEPSRSASSEDGIAHELAKRSGVELDANFATIIRSGHAGGAQALQVACDMLDSGAEHAIVGGVDTYYHPDVLKWLDHDYRLHALDAEDGILPGEGAAFAVLSNKRPRGETRYDNHAAVNARLVAVETSTEAAVDNDTPNTADAMTSLMMTMAEKVGKPRWVLTDVNGEHHRVREWSMVDLRQLTDDVIQQRYATQLGDIGAASGPTLLAVACQQFQRKVAPADRVLIALHSEGSERGLFAVMEGRP